MRTPKIQIYEDEKLDLEKRWREIGPNKERSESLRDDFGQLDEGVALLEARLMDVENVAANYEIFYNLEKEAGVSLNSFSIGMPFDGSGLAITNKKLSHFSAVPCQISMSGTLPQLLSFIDLLDRQEFIIRMDLLSVRTSGSEARTTNMEESLNVSMRCYALAEKDE